MAMSKLDIEKIKRKGIIVFYTKEAMLKYIKKASFSGYYCKMEIDYYNKKWFVRWK